MLYNIFSLLYTVLPSSTSITVPPFLYSSHFLSFFIPFRSASSSFCSFLTSILSLFTRPLIRFFSVSFSISLLLFCLFSRAHSSVFLQFLSPFPYFSFVSFHVRAHPFSFSFLLHFLTSLLSPFTCALIRFSSVSFSLSLLLFCLFSRAHSSVFLQFLLPFLLLHPFHLFILLFYFILVSDT